jgi:superfamily II DNA or RNA helicase
MHFYERFIGGFDLKWAVDHGWAVPPVCKLARVDSLDLSGISIAGGDFVQKQLQAELDKEKNVQRICVIAAEEMHGPTVLFAASVNGAKACAHYLNNNYGIPATFVYGTQPEEERNENLRLFKTGEAKVLCNCQVVAIGFDFPPTTTLIMGRPTRSRAFALQCWGRAARPLSGIVDFPGSTAESRRAAIAASAKPNFRIVDCTPSSQEHTLVTSVDMFVEMEQAVKKEVVKRALEAKEPLTPEQIAELAAKEAEKIASAKLIEEMRKNTTGRAFGRVTGQEINIEWRGKRSVGTYRNPLKGKYANMTMSQLPQHYVEWGAHEVRTAWIRSMFRKELARRYEPRLPRPIG